MNSALSARSALNLQRQSKDRGHKSCQAHLVGDFMCSVQPITATSLHFIHQRRKLSNQASSKFNSTRSQTASALNCQNFLSTSTAETLP